VKILIIQEYSRHPENAEYRECLLFQKAFNSIGKEIQADCWGLGHPNYKQQINFNDYDVILNSENYGDEWLPNFNNIKKPFKILYAIDPHVRGIQAYETICNNQGYNFMFVALRDFSSGPNKAWLPPGVDDQLFRNKNINKDIFMGFVGSYVNRKGILDHLTNKFGLEQHIRVLGDDMVNLINRFQVHFNMNISLGTNYRNFETIACETLLLTSACNEYDDLGFKNNENCLIYNNVQDLEEKILFCKNNPEKVKQIAAKGLELSNRHSYKRRAESVIKFLKSKI
jgi:glycosyltransferase involved in cell wall biosynthesis